MEHGDSLVSTIELTVGSTLIWVNDTACIEFLVNIAPFRRDI